MKKLLFSIIACCLLVSCASVFNGDYTRVFLYTSSPAQVVYKTDTLQTEFKNGFNAVTLSVPRSKDSLSLSIVSDSLDKKLNIPSRKSFAYYLNFYPVWWPGILMDMNNPRKYTYKSPLILDENLSIVKDIPRGLKRDMSERKKLLPNPDERRFMTYKGDIYIAVSMPYANYFSLRPEYEKRKDNFGFFGIGLGLDYYYSDKRFVSLTSSFSTDYPVPVPMGIDSEGAYTYVYSADILLTHNHRLKQISYGYGLAYACNLWYYEDKENDIHYSRSSSNLGIGLKGHYHFSSKFAVGLIYRPTFVVLNSADNKTFRYEHLLSIDLAFKFRLNKRK